MGVRTALVDRARVVDQAASDVKVAGSTQFTRVEGPWFRARLIMVPRPKTQEPSGGRSRVEARPRLMYDLRDENGDAVALTAKQRVEVDAVNLGHSVYELDGEPEPIRKKRSLSHFEVTLLQVIDHEFQPKVT